MSTVADRWMQACYPNVHLAQARPVEGRRTEMNSAPAENEDGEKELGAKRTESPKPPCLLPAVASPL